MGKSISWRDRNDKEPRSYGREVTFGKRKDLGRGYMAHSDRAGPGVIVLHEFFGLQDSFKRFADRLSDEGFTALAVDLYEGTIVDTVEDAKAAAQSLDEDHVLEMLGGAIRHLRDNWHPRVGVIGFSLGAGFACALASRHPLEATVCYYGFGDIDAAGWQGPLLGHFATEDDWEPLEYVRETFEKAEAGGVDTELHLYEGVGHWFANPAVPSAYDEASSEIAWDRTIEFLRYNLA